MFYGWLTLSTQHPPLFRESEDQGIPKGGAGRPRNHTWPQDPAQHPSDTPGKR